MKRPTLLPLWVLIGIVVLAGYFAYVKPAKAEGESTLVLKYMGTTIRLLNQPCTTEFVVTHAPDYSRLMKNAEADFSYTDRMNELHRGCWMEMNGADGLVIVSFWDDGDAMQFDRKLFAPEAL